MWGGEALSNLCVLRGEWGMMDGGGGCNLEQRAARGSSEKIDGKKAEFYYYLERCCL